MPGTKHLIQCHCVLPQYRNLKDPIFHKFVVFSRSDESGEIIEKLSKCNNCGVIHKITDFCKSEIAHGAESNFGIPTIEDIRINIPEKVCNILDKHKCDISTWEKIDDIFENEEWESQTVLSRQTIDSSTQVVVLIIKSKERFKIESHLIQDAINEK